MASTANAGFNVVLTALINSAFAAGAYHVLQSSVITPAAVGFLTGCSCMETTLSLMTAVYWGQLSKCEITKLSISQYSCDNKVAYGAVSLFATLLFLIQTIFTGSLIGWYDDVIDDNLQNGSATSLSVTSHNNTGARVDAGGSLYRNVPTTEDRNDEDIQVIAVVDRDQLLDNSEKNKNEHIGKEKNEAGDKDIQVVV